MPRITPRLWFDDQAVEAGELRRAYQHADVRSGGES